MAILSTQTAEQSAEWMKKTFGEWKPPKTRMEFIYGELGVAIYVIAVPDQQIVKIGISNDPGRRCVGIQTDKDVCVYWAVRLAKKDALKVEQAIHKRMAETLNHRRGEWYSMDPDTAVATIKQTIAQFGCKHRTDLSYSYADRY